MTSANLVFCPLVFIPSAVMVMMIITVITMPSIMDQMWVSLSSPSLPWSRKITHNHDDAGEDDGGGGGGSDEGVDDDDDDQSAINRRSS